MLSAICFNLDQSKISSSGNRLRRKTQWFVNKILRSTVHRNSMEAWIGAIAAATPYSFTLYQMTKS